MKGGKRESGKGGEEERKKSKIRSHLSRVADPDTI